MEEDKRKNVELVPPNIHVLLSLKISLRKSLKSFFLSHPCLPVPAWPNTNLRFSLFDISKPKLSDFLLTLNTLAWFLLMSCYLFLLSFNIIIS